MLKRFDTFNDGVLQVCESDCAVSDFDAVKNATASDLSTVCTLAYQTMSKRQSDVDFAQSQGRKLDMKVKTRYVRGVTTRQRVLIGRELYAIYQVDDDKRVMYLYLELEREL